MNENDICTVYIRLWPECRESGENSVDICIDAVLVGIRLNSLPEPFLSERGGHLLSEMECGRGLSSPDSLSGPNFLFWKGRAKVSVISSIGEFERTFRCVRTAKIESPICT